MQPYNSTRDAAFIVLNVAAVLVAFSTLVLLSQEKFFLALFAVLSIAVLMEGRIQLAGRLPKTWIFWTHMGAAIALLCALVSTLVWAPNILLLAFIWLCTALTFGMGAVLWLRGFRRYFAAH